MLPQEASSCTPPSSDIELDQRLPPSPPQSPKPQSRSNVDRLVTFLRLRKAGQPIAYPTNCDWKRFKLSPAQFEEFCQRLRDEVGLRAWFDDKARYEYDPTEAEFVLRMPSAVLERFLACVEDAISAAITALAVQLAADHHEAAAESLRKIYNGRSTTLELHAPKLENSSQSSQSSAGGLVVQRSPDASFFHPGGALPALILEVSYSQQRKALPRIAERYIVDSRHQIRCVLGLDVTYASGKRKDKTATVSVWRPAMEQDEEGDDVGVCRCDVDAVAFRAGDGTACEGEIELSTSDFLPCDILDTLPEVARSGHFTITFAQLAEFLADAEKINHRHSRTLTKKFRKRKRTPSEDLSDHREEAFAKQEEADLEKEQRADDEWNEPGHINASAGQIEVVERRRSKRNKSGRSVGEAS
ncbi:hypothetical protein CLAFUW4_10578 [Fulvia fulva]|uniref:Uncharacterized protein n=1 Tax=Passalora fulva TaxID=5499 RepID=A0A9Q8LGF3_PASFU|nr:uncharacterized protein CLAFUR5_05193 [Fulvia fulva]KAK4615467.1 hypothetical protein CLAFUR4_10583 [Fulvia fulva]KAK4617252.1 hypothetical protein CLAFUR0_10661 [Fulvia fulva]UJO16930.1 hypothetical protein CLAFUR5_05193 [Fulvia fulva]WPV19764.1 hypothetical protein CLAFUW4_10578 [Fulvia fulva]WPV34095.1 hypothetical protein CLAFUW7_10580 [Fulvia fulva]